MKSLVAPYIAALRPVSPGKSVDALERESGVIARVRLGANENPFGPSPKVQQLLRDVIWNVQAYPDDDVHMLRTRLSSYLGVNYEEIAVGCGSSALIDLIARTFATGAEHAIVGHPSFPAYSVALAAAHVNTTVVPLRDGLFWDLSRVRAAVVPETKLVFLDNPCNPTGTHIAEDELRNFLSELPPDVIVVVDEAYAEYADAATYQSALCMRHLRERLIVLRTFSKAHALAGLRVGYAVARRDLIEPLDAMRVPYSVSSLGQAAALASLDDVEALRRTVTWNSRERERLAQALQRAGLLVAPSQTNFLFVSLPCAASAVVHAMLQRGVIVRALGPALPRHVRVSVGLRADTDRFLHVLQEVLHNLSDLTVGRNAAVRD